MHCVHLHPFGGLQGQCLPCASAGISHLRSGDRRVSPGNNSLSKIPRSPLWPRSTHTLYSGPSKALSPFTPPSQCPCQVPFPEHHLERRPPGPVLSKGSSDSQRSLPSSAPPPTRPGCCSPQLCLEHAAATVPVPDSFIHGFSVEPARFEHETPVSATSPVAVMQYPSKDTEWRREGVSSQFQVTTPQQGSGSQRS